MLVAAVVAALLLGGDAFLKLFVRAHLAVCDVARLANCQSLDLLGPLRLVRAENAGSALGYAPGWQLWVVLAVAGVALVPAYARRLGSFGLVGWLAVGLQMGGGLGNLLERLTLGGATDMFTLGSVIVWNLADIGLVTGSLLATAVIVVGIRRSEFVPSLTV